MTSQLCLGWSLSEPHQCERNGLALPPAAFRLIDWGHVSDRSERREVLPLWANKLDLLQVTGVSKS